MRHKFLLTCLLASLTIPSFSQELKSLKECLDAYKMYRYHITMGMWKAELGQGGVETLTPYRASREDIQSILEEALPLSTEYESQIKDYYSSVIYAELLNDSSDKKLDFFVRGQNDIGIYLGAYWYEGVFNTLRVDENERCVKVVKEVLMPLVYKAYSAFKTTPLKSVLLMGACASKSFAEDSETPKSDIVACLVDFADIGKVIDDYELTEDELFSKMSFYVAGRDTDLKKVALFK